MKVSAAQAERFADSPDPALRAVLAFGPDSGLVRERAERIARSVVADLSDPFRVTEMTAAQLGGDPARLADEMGAIAMTGGRRVVRLRDAADSAAGILGDLLAAPPGDALLVVEAGDLPPRSALRKLFEQSAIAAALPCYKDDAHSLPAVIRQGLADLGFEVSPDALGFLAARLGADRQLTRRELEKLALYMGREQHMGREQQTDTQAAHPSARARVELQDAVACVGDTAALTLDDLVYAVGDSDLAALERVLERSLLEGLSAIALLRAAANHFHRLHYVAGTIKSGTPAGEAVKRLRPPLFWKVAERFKRQAAAWTPEQLAKALNRLLEAEMACKSSGAPSEVLASRALLEIAANGPLRNRR